MRATSFFFFNNSCAGWRSHEVIRSDFKGLLQTLKHRLHLFILAFPIFIASFTLYSYSYRVIHEQMTLWHDNRKRKDSLCFQPISAGGISILESAEQTWLSSRYSTKLSQCLMTPLWQTDPIHGLFFLCSLLGPVFLPQ